MCVLCAPLPYVCVVDFTETDNVSLLQCVVVYCSVLQCVAVCCSSR